MILCCDGRSVEELQNDGIEKTLYSKGSSNCFDGEVVASPESSEYANGKSHLENPVSGRSNGTQKVNGHYIDVPEKDRDMESALLHQAQLICRYEEEEKAQREWEEKFGENFGPVRFFGHLISTLYNQNIVCHNAFSETF